MKRQNARKSFTLLELLIVIAIAVIIAGGLVPLFGVTKKDAKIAKLLALIDALKDASMRYYFDTGEYAIEFGNFGESCPQTHRKLSCDPGVSGWQGPYISRPLMEEDNPLGVGTPFESSFYLHDLVQTDFDFDGDGSVDRRAMTAGNSISFDVDSEATGKKIDDMLDKGIGGSNWQSSGKVQYWVLGGESWIFIYVLGGETN